MFNPIYPCLWFNNNANQAAHFYCSIFTNSTITSTNPIVTQFKLNNFKIMALNGGPTFTINPAISLYVNCKTITEVDNLWQKLIDGGKVMMPLNQYPWSERYGWLVDKYDVTWQITLNPNTAVSPQIIPAFLFTKKQFGQANEAINFYTSIFASAQITQHQFYDALTNFEGKTLFAEFMLHNTPFIAMDGPGDHNFNFNEGISLVVNCDTQAEIDHYWNALSAVPEAEQCGWLKDKFGVSWQIVPSILGQLMSNPDKAPKVTAAFLKMKKFDIETLLNV
ncbi:MAG: VOC family protein [Bacteroidia bacterium]|nr:VOC family protein [Bacteroidia bacterium]MBP9689913.1 VOC family protein [Bacteroidia bacterium]